MSEPPFPPVSEANEIALQQFAPLYKEDYRTFKIQFIEWLLEEGKNPIKAEGYAKNTVKQTHYKLEAVFRWLWNEHEEFTKEIPPKQADEYTTTIIKSEDDSIVLDKIKSIKRLHKYKNNTKDRNYDWEYEHKDQLEVSTHGKKSKDYFKRHELNALYEATLGYGTVKSYHNKNMTPEERDQIKTVLAQRFEKPKNEIGPDDFSRANSWKIPSIIALSIDIGLRPIEVGRAKTTWVYTDEQEVIIPAKESTKNDEAWKCKFSAKTANALDLWLEERASYEKYDNTNALWLTKVGTPYSSDSLNPILDDLKEEAGIKVKEEDPKNLSFYAIRRGCATMWAADGTLKDAKTQLRHTELETTDNYATSPGKNRADLVNDLW